MYWFKTVQCQNGLFNLKKNVKNEKKLFVRKRIEMNKPHTKRNTVKAAQVHQQIHKRMLYIYVK